MSTFLFIPIFPELYLIYSRRHFEVEINSSCIYFRRTKS